MPTHPRLYTDDFNRSDLGAAYTLTPSSSMLIVGGELHTNISDGTLAWASFLEDPDVLLSPNEVEFDFYVPPTSTTEVIAYEVDINGNYIYIDNVWAWPPGTDWYVSSYGIPNFEWTPVPDNWYHARVLIDRLAGTTTKIWLTRFGDTESISPQHEGVLSSTNGTYGAHGIGMQGDGSLVAKLDNLSIREILEFSADSFISEGYPFHADSVLLLTVSQAFTANAVVAGRTFAADALIADLPATRFYFETGYSPNITPAYSAGWNATASAVRAILWPNQAQSSINQALNGVAETSAAEQNVLLVQYVTGPLPAQTIDGYIRGYIGATQSNAAADMRMQSRIRVVSQDGLTERGTLVDFNNNTLTEEFPANGINYAGHRSRRVPLAWSGQGILVSPVTLLDGDRVIVEVGYRTHNVVTTSYTGSLARNSTSLGSTDFTGYDEVATNRIPWIEFTDIDLPPEQPTRLYLSSLATPPVSHAYDAAWEHTSHATRRLTSTDPAKVRSPRTFFDAWETSGADNYDQAVLQLVSPPITATTLIDGRVKAVAVVQEGSSLADLQSQMVVRVIADDGTVRGTLLPADATVTLQNEWTANGGGGLAKFPLNYPTPEGTALTPVTAQVGDRIVVELGSRTTTVRTSEQRARIAIGSAEFETYDFFELVNRQDSDRRPWIEFSDSIPFDERWWLADAVIKTVDVPGSFTANAVFVDRKEATFSADAVLLKTILSTAAPTVRAVANYASNSGTAKTATLPTNVNGDLLVAYWSLAFSASTVNINAPAGWQFRGSYLTNSDQIRIVVFTKVAQNESVTAAFTTTASRAAAAWIYSVSNADDLTQLFLNGETGETGNPIPSWTAPALITKNPDTLLLLTFHGDNNSPSMTGPSGWTRVGGTVAGASNAWVDGYYRTEVNSDVTHQPTLTFTSNVYAPGATISEAHRTNAFSASAILHPENNTFPFTADAFIQLVQGYGDFTANAIVKRTVTVTWIRADALLLVGRFASTFTADAFLRVITNRYFTANSYIVKPVIPAEVLAARTGVTLNKKVTMHVLRRRDRPLDAYVPPRIPDVREEQGIPVPCLPPCPPNGAGWGTDWGVGSGAAVQRDVVRCTDGNVLFGFDTDYMGRSPSETSNGHAGYDQSHNKNAHVTRLWVAYPSVPDGEHRMRAKLTWDATAGDSVTVDVYGNIDALPGIGPDESIPFNNDVWNGGEIIGKLTFVKDATGAIDGVSSNYQTQPSEFTFNAANISTNIFRFQLHNEGQSYLGRFKASNVDIVSD